MVFGISINPGEVIVGRDGWLFLGDDYGYHHVSYRRKRFDSSDDEIARKIERSGVEWSKWLSANGVNGFKLLMVPDKETVYPEHLPSWARGTGESPGSFLLKYAPRSIAVDATEILLRAKERLPVYFSTDTHWDSFGAWRTFNETFKEWCGHLRCLSEADVKLKLSPRRPGDLADLLHVKYALPAIPDRNVIMALKRKILIRRSDFETGRLIATTRNREIQAPTRFPLLVEAPGALNNKRLLWFTDSFGIAMSPYVAATFSQTIQMHYDSAVPDRFASIVQRFKPDYVLITVVARNFRHDVFQSLPPEASILH